MVRRRADGPARTGAAVIDHETGSGDYPVTLPE